MAIKKGNTNRLVIGLIFIIVGYLFFANISWFNLDFIDPHEIEFQVPSYSLAKSIAFLDFNSSLSIILSPRTHPFLPVLLVAFLKIFFLPLNLNEFFTIKAFYFLCYLTSLICIYRLLLFYTVKNKLLSGIIALLYAFSCPYYYQTLLEGKAPEDILANTFLFLCFYAYLYYRMSLDRGSSNKTRCNAALLSLLMACCFFSKYNVGVFIAFSIAIDLSYICFISKRYSIKELGIFYIFSPFCVLIASWFLSSSFRSGFFSYLSERMAVNSKVLIDPFYYLKLLFIQNGPFVHSISGAWMYKGELDMRYFYHWGQSAIALFCLLTAYMEMIKNYKRKECSNEYAFILLPLIYVSINLLFFSSNKYHNVAALISTIPVMWLIVGHQIPRFLCFSGNILLTRSSLRKSIQYSAVALIVAYLFICACLQYFGLNSQIIYFTKLNNTKQLSRDSNEVIAEIEKFAVDNNCVCFITAQQDVSFFENYLFALIRYRLSKKFPRLLPYNVDKFDKGGNVLIVEMSSLPVKKLFSDAILDELRYYKSKGNAKDISFSGQSYAVDFYCLSSSQFKSSMEYFRYFHERLKKRQYKGRFF